MFEQSFLDQQGANPDAEGHIVFPGFDIARDPCPDNFITLAPGFHLLLASGADTCDFLHAQLTCDVKGIADGSGCTAAWCNPGGRVITTFVIYRLADEFLLLMPAALKDHVVKRLRMFVLRADVTFTDLNENHALMAARGRSETIPEKSHDFTVTRLNERLHLFLPDHSGESRCLIADKTEVLQAVWRDLAGTMPPVDSRCWDLLDIHAGIPWLNGETTEQFLPQELSLEETGGLSFNKGCYPGQEVVARVHYRGRVKRRLYHARAGGDEEVAPGMKVKDQDGKSVGIVVTASLDSKGVPLLAVLDTAVAETGILSLENGSKLQIRAAVYHEDI